MESIIMSVLISLNVVMPAPQKAVDQLPFLPCGGLERVLLKGVNLDPGPACIGGTAETYRVF